MSNIQYVIRHNDFTYNDEWFQTSFPEAGIIEAIYDSKADAEQAFKQLIVSALYDAEDLSNYDIGNGYATDETYEALEQFVLEKTGQEYETDDAIPELSLDDAFEFAKISGVMHYQLIEIDNQKPIYILWLNEEEDYLRSENNNVFASQDAHFTDVALDQFVFTFDNYCEEKIYNQKLDEISEGPELLRSLIKNMTEISLDEKNESITEIDWDDITFTQLQAFNSLLSEKMFEVKIINLKQLEEIINN